MSESTVEIPPELIARLAHPTVRLSGLIDGSGSSVVPQQPGLTGIGRPRLDRRGAL
jgi:hypothetical protein